MLALSCDVDFFGRFHHASTVVKMRLTTVLAFRSRPVNKNYYLGPNFLVVLSRG